MEMKNLFKPKWQHSNPEVREAAVKNLTDQALLAEIAKNDRDKWVREAAMKKIIDQDLLAEIDRNDKEREAQLITAEKLKDKSFAQKKTDQRGKASGSGLDIRC